MEENKVRDEKNPSEIVKFSSRQFLFDIPKGFAMGIAFIIPGFSGGSVAAILGIYERLVGAVADIFRDFKRSIITLAPLLIGLALGAVSLLYPLGWALSAFPIPTVSIFVGLALGGLPSVTDKLKGKINATDILAFCIPFLFAIALCFVPIGAEKNLLDMSFWGYPTLALVGFVGSCALVIPGISGSMLLLILGYYNPLVRLLTDHLLKGKDVLHSILALGSAGIGLVIGFFVISIIMKKMLREHPRGTHFSILGFILGSLPTVYVSTVKEAGLTLSTLPSSPLHWIACILLLGTGFIAAFCFVMWAKSYSNKKEKE